MTMSPYKTWIPLKTGQFFEQPISRETAEAILVDKNQCFCKLYKHELIKNKNCKK